MRQYRIKLIDGQFNLFAVYGNRDVFIKRCVYQTALYLTVKKLNGEVIE